MAVPKRKITKSRRKIKTNKHFKLDFHPVTYSIKNIDENNLHLLNKVKNINSIIIKEKTKTKHSIMIHHKKMNLLPRI